MNTEKDIEYRSLDSEQYHQASCTSLSGSKISFISEHALTEGKAMEVIVHTNNPKNPYFTAYIETLRSKKVYDNQQQEQFEVHATIKIIKGN